MFGRVDEKMKEMMNEVGKLESWNRGRVKEMER